MVALRFNFGHPFDGKVFLRKIGCAQPWCQSIPYNSDGEHDFDVALPVAGDGTYQVILNWEFEGRSFSHESTITIKDGEKLEELTY
ncbi:hypothetical protein [Mucilaginibacter sp. AK015]|uniref:hypothetical protein n=1 Tax=Mucilaginibacter sp. AK015 TaxID=2723072 RepID=UPI0016146376|nr:hypothetical protein [Mucilaginibacter sp. AK015]MBB5396903.1 hypothetical protein [Mucilaginibacter sp. AK015]